MSNNGLISSIYHFPLCLMQKVTMNYCGSVFHCAGNVVFYNYLVVFAPWIFELKEVGKILDHSGCFAKDCLSMLFVFLSYIVIYCYFSSVLSGPVIFYNCEIPDGHHKEIGRMWLFHLPVVCSGAVLVGCRIDQ